MYTPAIALLFLMMVVAPCIVAVRSSQPCNEDGSDPLEMEAPEDEPRPIRPPILMADPDSRPKLRHNRRSSLQALAHEAEADARIARDRAEQAHWASLVAEARAAAIRADAAAEAAARAGRAAEKAILAAEYDRLPDDHPSLDFPRSRARKPAA